MTGAPWLDSPVKRAIDIAVAGTALVIVSPVMAVVALLVRSRLGSPVLFRDPRAGRDGTPIDIIKFRSMSDACDPTGERLPDAERLGQFGQALRASSLDELPQFISVVRGDMSLIGPRPLPMAYVDRYDATQRRRLVATPGLTGWAQVHGRNTLDWPSRLAHDVWYVDHASFRIDLRIVALTVRVLLGRGGVSADGHVTMPAFLGNAEPETVDLVDERPISGHPGAVPASNDEPENLSAR